MEKYNYLVMKIIPYLFLLVTGFIHQDCMAQFFGGLNAKAGNSRMIVPRGISDFSYFMGADAGYEFLDHIPVSLGIGYGVLSAVNHYDDEEDKMEIEAIRIPLKAGYCYDIGNIRIYAGAGMFVSFDRMKAGKVKPVSEKYKPYPGFLFRGGIGYRLFDRLLFSVGLDYNRPFNKHVKLKSDNELNGLYFYGVDIGMNWYF